MLQAATASRQDVAREPDVRRRGAASVLDDCVRVAAPPRTESTSGICSRSIAPRRNSERSNRASGLSGENAAARLARDRCFPCDRLQSSARSPTSSTPRRRGSTRSIEKKQRMIALLDGALERSLASSRPRPSGDPSTSPGSTSLAHGVSRLARERRRLGRCSRVRRSTAFRCSVHECPARATSMRLGGARSWQRDDGLERIDARYRLG